MTPLRTLTLTAFFALAISVRIQDYTRSGNTVRFDCREDTPTGDVLMVTDPTRFFLNSSARVVTTLLEERNIDYNFDPTTKVFSFDVQQDLEGCYYCGNSTSLSTNCITIVGM